MRRAVFIIVVMAAVCVTSPVYAQDKDTPEPPRGMELLKVGDANVMVPKGTKMRKQGDLNVIEDIGEYVGRKFLDTEERFEKVEARQERMEQDIEEGFERLGSGQDDMKEEIRSLKKALDELKEEKDPEEEAETSAEEI
jgi:hypothetical protein